MRTAACFLALLTACGGSSAPPAGTAPTAAAPTNVSAIPANGRVTLSWSAAAGASSYQIVRAFGSAAQIGETDQTSFTDTTAKNGVIYTYTVRAVYPSGAHADSVSVQAQPFRQLCVADAARSQVVAFNAENINTSVTTVSGSQTGLIVEAVAVDGTHGEIFSANPDLGTVTTHGETAAGNVKPLRTLDVPGAHFVAYEPADDTLVVVTDGGIETFARTDQGSVRPLRSLGSTLRTGFGQLALSGPLHGDRLFLVNQLDATIQVFGRTDHGVVAPTVIEPQGIDRAFSIGAIVYDPDTDELLVGAAANGSAGIFAYPASATGPVSPTRSLSNGAAGFSLVSALALDEARGTLYAASVAGAVLAFSDQFAGSVAPPAASVISGPLTGLIAGRHALAIDAVNGVLVEGGDNGLLTFPLGASGNVAPLSSVDSSSSGILVPKAMIADRANGEILILDGAATPAVTAFPYGPAFGAPLRSVAVGPADFTAALAVDATHDELFVTNGPARVDIFARTASGTASPLRSISGSQTGLASIRGIAYDPAGDALVVATATEVRRYARSFVDGNEAPLTVISGSNTGLRLVQNVTFDAVNGEILVADANTGVVVFHPGDNGNVSPVRTYAVTDPASHIGPEDVLVDPVADELFIRAGPSIQALPRAGAGAAGRVVTTDLSGLFLPNQMIICN
jgi:hypothetical protein